MSERPPSAELQPPPLLDEDGWPILENATHDDIVLAAKACRGMSMYGNFLRAALAGIYAERARHDA